jgi:two-component system, chemotaxis family, protein-glutamate methylesterase/glutaminase
LQANCAGCTATAMPPTHSAGPLRIIGIGASTGGPLALRKLLECLPRNAPPIVVVQHMAASFVDRFAQYLKNAVPHQVSVASDGQSFKPGVIYLAGGEQHLTIREHAGFLTAVMTDAQPVHYFKPSISVLFESIAHTVGSRAAGVLLTGIGEDGAGGLHALRAGGAMTYAQDEGSAAVFGMPRAAILAGAAKSIGCPVAIGRHIAASLIGITSTARIAGPV